jgi:hypothetical protein
MDRKRTYPNVIFQFYSSGRVELDLLQCLTDNIVGLALARLGGLDGGCLVNVPLIIDVELAEGIGQGEDVVLLELRKFPGKRISIDCVGYNAPLRPSLLSLGRWECLPLELENVHGDVRGIRRSGESRGG